MVAILVLIAALACVSERPRPAPQTPAATPEVTQDTTAQPSPTSAPQATATATPEPHPPPSVALDNGFLYSKKVSSESRSEACCSTTHEVLHLENAVAKPTALFRIEGRNLSGGWNLARFWRLIPEEPALLVNRWESLVRYNLKTGEPTLIYSASKDSSIIGFAISHDRQRLVLTEGSFRVDPQLIVLDYSSDVISYAILATVPLPRLPNGGTAMPGVWSPDDRTIFFQVYAQNDHPIHHFSMANRDGSGFNTLPALSGGMLSPDERWYAYTEGELPGNCLSYPRSAISLLDLSTTETVTVASRSLQDYWFYLRAWSPDRSQLLYSSRDSNEPCGQFSNFREGEKSYVFDLLTMQSRSIASWVDQKAVWLDQTPVVSRSSGFTENAETNFNFRGELLIHGQVVDSGEIIYLGAIGP